ncbi:DNA-binding transcriptional LysR family regulator [Paucibacter oligotrophus]|uniref:DNA-binding transcriptional LysR family regulator n=1 Tax=Roseateles oligotrophus TaxID=1769250 RepID=A0A840L930_9BURK|nr:LysR family transcriptional regulator [Roseateles oligotrophus]MBB4843265.1 DNA-binding transcriptional LysR family regulator [Roseateles oligotrophus]
MTALHLSLRQLQVFTAVARSGSTTAASEAIALSQSATSSALKQLERLLGQPLFDRVGKRLQLNENGRSLLPRALALLDGAADVQALARRRDVQAQALRIGASTTLGSYVLPDLLARFYAQQQAAAAPSWASRLSIANTAQICRAVARFELDIGLIEGPCHEPDLAVQPWLRDELLIVAAPSHALLAEPRRPPSLQQLREQLWLLREPGAGTREATDQWLLPQLHAYQRSVELNSSEAIKRLAVAGLGLACLSRWVLADALAAGQLQVLATPLPARSRPCYWVRHRGKQSTPALQAFIALLGEAAAGKAGAQSGRKPASAAASSSRRKASAKP